MPEVTAVPMAPEVPVTLDDGVVRLVSPDQVRPAELLGYVTRNRAFLREFEPAREDGYYTEGAQRELLEGELAAWREDRGYRLYVRLVAEGGLLIGIDFLHALAGGEFLAVTSAVGPWLPAEIASAVGAGAQAALSAENAVQLAPALRALIVCLPLAVAAIAADALLVSRRDAA